MWDWHSWGEVKQRITALVGGGGIVQDGDSGDGNNGRQHGHGRQQDGVGKKQAAERGWRGVKGTAAAQYYCMHSGRYYYVLLCGN